MRIHAFVFNIGMLASAVTAQSHLRLKEMMPSLPAKKNGEDVVDDETLSHGGRRLARSLCKGKNKCDDNNACTDDSCAPLTGICVNEPINCDDNNACTDDSCEPSTGCVYTDISQSCNDNDACTDDTCEPSTGCVNEPIICDNNDACTVGTCDSSTGMCGYTTINCDDDNACTDDSCDPLTGCVYTPNSSSMGTLVGHMSNSTDKMFYYPGGLDAFDGTQDNGLFVAAPFPKTPDFLRPFPFYPPKTISFRTGDGRYRADFDYEKFRQIIVYAGDNPAGTVYTLTRDGVTRTGEEGSILSRDIPDAGDPWIKLHWPMCDIKSGAYDCDDILWAFDNVISSYGDVRNALKNAHGGVNVYVC
jgi:hypothetical protein